MGTLGRYSPGSTTRYMYDLLFKMEAFQPLLYDKFNFKDTATKLHKIYSSGIQIHYILSDCLKSAIEYIYIYIYIY